MTDDDNPQPLTSDVLEAQRVAVRIEVEGQRAGIRGKMQVGQAVTDEELDVLTRLQLRAELLKEAVDIAVRAEPHERQAEKNVRRSRFTDVSRDVTKKE